MAWNDPFVGPRLDNVRLELNYSKFELSEETVQTISALISFPIKSIPAVKVMYLLMDDLWLYYYSVQNFTGII